ncbi:(d)CMP kinase [Nakamurella endophytica]|uniref:Cytidylate kinase n=1 Tax=Nakamurella endophytica TaxID=1748367 RepID=A0A917T8D8_9ACTN|nr:(d)CMP kinase [Nakamurella endophytica]GGM13344.1 cytidylate kinase [Nakamurella endophytica]
MIAIDGPSGTGKSTVSRRVAAALHAGYLDTGAMYRIVALEVLRAGLDPADQPAVADLLPRLDFDSPTDPEDQRQVSAGVDVTQEIRSQAVTFAVTPVSANPAVRSWLLDRQRRLARSGRMVVEGRDIGTVIVPEAALKIYLTADEGERARRRHRQNRAAGTTDAGDVGSVALDLARRDRMDSSRVHAPLQAAADAVLVDSSGLQIDETVTRVLELAAERGIR